MCIFGISYEWQNLVISSYQCTAIVPWCVCRNNVHGGGQILSKKYCHVKEQKDENCHFKGVTAMKSLRNTTKHIKLAHLDLPNLAHFFELITINLAGALWDVSIILAVASTEGFRLHTGTAYDDDDSMPLPSPAH